MNYLLIDYVSISNGINSIIFKCRFSLIYLTIVGFRFLT